MALGVRQQSEHCNSTARRNAECTSEAKPQGIAFIIGWTQPCNLEIHCAIAPKCIARLVLLERASKYSRNDKILKRPNLAKWQNCPFCKGYKNHTKKSLSTHVRDGLGEKRPKIHKNIFKKWHHFEKWQKWPFCKGCSKAKSSKMPYLGDEFRWSRIIQKVTVNTHKRCFMGLLGQTSKCQNQL